ncbi:hypothetical protein Taro_039716 [Colocasia esculenta]|uniref:Uncharacterized protein n=1 Tax=Colocasia esculenta TaxID=4460 RepID=A0A843WQY5_COLES|nr:hypothetical protein [Colocasia esculenta]
MRVATGSTEIATGACTSHDRLSQVGSRSQRQALSRSDHDRGHCRDRPCERGLSGCRVHRVCARVRHGLRLEELEEELEGSFLSTNSPPLDLSSWSKNLLARARAGHEVAGTQGYGARDFRSADMRRLSSSIHQPCD